MILRHILRHIKNLFNTAKYIEYYELNRKYKEHPAMINFVEQRMQTLREHYIEYDIRYIDNLPDDIAGIVTARKANRTIDRASLIINKNKITWKIE